MTIVWKELSGKNLCVEKIVTHNKLVSSDEIGQYQAITKLYCKNNGVEKLNISHYRSNNAEGGFVSIYGGDTIDTATNTLGNVYSSTTPQEEEVSLLDTNGVPYPYIYIYEIVKSANFSTSGDTETVNITLG